jgi:predicted metal-dependent hydrolase
VGKERLSLEVRERNYHYDETIPRYYDSGNAILTFEWDALALIIPSGERFFVQSVQALAPKAKGTDLKAQIKGFIGQEAMHAKETNRSLEPLERQGFPVVRFQTWFGKLLRWFFQLPFPRCMLAGTAAAEHYTAAVGRWNISTRSCDGMPPALRDMWYWHGAEELEHKSVAFDLLQELAPNNYLIRFTGFIFGMGLVWIGYRKAMSMLIRHSGLSKAQVRKERKSARKIRVPLVSFRFPGLFNYLRPGFHPNKIDDRGMCNKILAEQAVFSNPGS